MLFNTLAQSNEGKLRDRDAPGRCRTRQFAYHLDSFDFKEFCPVAIRKVGVKGLSTLRWHPAFNVHGPWTRSGDDAWPAWMRGLKEYRPCPTAASLQDPRRLA